LAPPSPKAWVHSLPPILRIRRQHSLLRCSKGARGLFVLRRATGVFTGTTNSQCSTLRQRSNRYAIRAGRNLPDKEFRYLRTVIVTAAVYRGFNSRLRPCGLTSPFNLPAPGRRQTLYVVFDFAEPCVFSKQSLEPLNCNSPMLRGARPLTSWSTPSPEVTGSFCLVPKRGVSLGPEYFLLAYLCRFAVRVHEDLLRGFSRQRGVCDFTDLAVLAIVPQGMRVNGFTCRLPLQT
jgi:hypothetical protein